MKLTFTTSVVGHEVELKWKDSSDDSEHWIKIAPVTAIKVANMLREMAAISLQEQGIDPKTIPEYVGTKDRST